MKKDIAQKIKNPPSFQTSKQNTYKQEDLKPDTPEK